MTIPCLSDPTRPFNAIFIRAPAVHSLTSTDLEVLAQLPDECKPSLPPSDTAMGPANDADLGKVMIRQGTKLVTSFHPELSGDERIHEYWLNKCVLGQ
jgi:5'-phosphate synthase pdxT subunit